MGVGGQESSSGCLKREKVYTSLFFPVGRSFPAFSGAALPIGDATEFSGFEGCLWAYGVRWILRGLRILKTELMSHFCIYW